MTTQADKTNSIDQQAHPAFEFINSQTIDSLNISVEHYVHKVTGAVHYHINADNDENVFLVALRTVPEDSTGVAHMLEHTVLCGSERYPVRDPFFMMIRRSLNTFMNAFTSSDWTAYPFASKNQKDFGNLLDVYLDAVFFSRIHELDFKQEGHRVEFETLDDENTDLVYKGVVFNEMKGAMSSPVSLLWQTLTKYLFPETTYHHNSGGDPESITDLSYDELKAFYEKHYHPSNAVFMTFGNIPAQHHHAVFEEKVLSRFERSNDLINVRNEKRYYAPVNIEESYAIDAAELEDGQPKTHIVMGWLLGNSVDLESMLKAHLLSGVLLDNSSSPLRHALEITDLGSAPSPLCGLEDSNREMSFMCGIEGSQPEHAAALETLVLSVLEDVAENGVEQDKVEAVLHQLELSQREIGGDGYPYGLQLILGGLSAAIHRGNPIDVLNLDPVLEKLHEEIKDPEFIKTLVRDQLLNNQHRVRLTLKPDANLATNREQAEVKRLQQIKNGLTEQEKQSIIRTAEDLLARQQTIDDPEILPKVTLVDVPAKMHIAKGDVVANDNISTSFYPQGTNGIIYQQLLIDLPELDETLIDVLPHYANIITELGCGDKDYMQMQAIQASVSGGINAYTSVRGAIDDVEKVRAHLVLSGKALAKNHLELSGLLREIFTDVRFDEKDRIRELVAQKRARMEQSVTGNGHSLAMTAATSKMSSVACLSHRLSGMKGIQQIKKLDEALKDPATLDTFISNLKQLHQLLNKSPRQVLLVAEQDQESSLLKDVNQAWADVNAQIEENAFRLSPVCKDVKQIWLTSTQVNFCSAAYKTVPVDHVDAAALTVLGGFLRNGYLHTAIRENGGAYGGGASQDSNVAAFRFYSYRDPRLTETLGDFEKSIEWMLEEKHEARMLEEAILGVIGAIDKPSSPAGEAKQAFHNNLYGRTEEQRQRYRERVLAVTMDDLLRVTRQYLQNQPSSVAVITNPQTQEAMADSDFDVYHL